MMLQIYRRSTRFLQPLFAAAFFLSLNAASGSVARADVPDVITRYEMTRVTLRSTTGARSATQAVALDIEAGGRAMTLALAPSPVVGAHTRIVTVGDDGVRTTTPRARYLQGEVAGEPGSRAAFTLADGTAHGAFLSRGEVWFVEPATRYLPGSAADDVVVYRGSDVDVSAIVASCGTSHQGGDPEATSGSLVASGVATADSRVGARGAGGTPTDRIDIAMVADYELFQEQGASTASYVLGILNLVDAIYGSELDITLRATEALVHETAADPFSSTNSSSALLDEFAAFRQASSGAVHDAGLAHLLTGRNLSGSVIGQGFLDVLCSTNAGVAISEVFSTSSFLMTVLVAHEMGHNFGAYHDGEAGSPCQAADPTFIMGTPLTNSTVDQFSSCSAGMMSAAIASAGCVVPSIPVGCGNGMLGGSEDCDDGNNVGGDCCAFDCTFELAGSQCADDGNVCTDDECNGAGSCVHPGTTAGTACPDDGNVCTDDECDGAGSCAHPGTTGSCDDGNICTTDGTCAVSACTASATPVRQPKSKLKVSVRDGAANDKLNVKSEMFVGPLLTTPAIDGLHVLLADTSANVLFEGTIAAEDLLVLKGGVVFKFRADGTEAPSLGGISSAKIKYREGKETLVVKVKGKEAEAAGVLGKAQLVVTLDAGGAGYGQCDVPETLPCEPGSAKLTCRSL